MDPRNTTPAQRATNPVPTRDDSSVPVPQRDAVLNVVRSEIDSIYGGASGQDTPHTTPVSTPQSTPKQQTPETSTNPYHKTHTQPNLDHAEAWRKYHSAWQQYYQKYYEQYYVNEVSKNTPKKAGDETEPTSSEGLTQDEAMYELRQNIINKAQESAHKVRRSRHFVPIAAGVCVMVAFALLQYNQVLIANVKAYMSPGAIQAQNIIIDPNSSVPVGPDTKMIIPKINVDAPIVMGVGPTNEDQLKAMSDGIAHVKYPGAIADPGQVGNAVFSAHSSSDWTDTGAYKFIFVQLDHLAVDDVVYINYQSKQYTYKVYDVKTVAPNDVGALNYTGSDPVITLITCTPLGTAQKRLLVFAKQISPDPAGASKPTAAQEASSKTSTQITGTSPTFLEQLFGAK